MILMFAVKGARRVISAALFAVDGMMCCAGEDAAAQNDG